MTSRDRDTVAGGARRPSHGRALPGGHDAAPTGGTPRRPGVPRAHDAVQTGVWVLVAGVVYALAVLTPTGQRWDALGLQRVYRGDRVHAVAAEVRPALPALLGVAVVVLAVLAVGAGRWRTAAAAPVVVALVGVLSPFLRDHVLLRPYHGDLGFPENTFPSTHMAVTTALAWAVVALLGATRGAVPAWLRVLLSLVLAGEAAANLLSYAHRPADLLGGFALATATWYLTAALLGRERPG